MAQKQKKKTAADRKKFAVRVICLVTAGILVLSTLIAALLNQAW